MDLGIRGRRALVCASSRGLGLGCARALAAEGVDLCMVARRDAVLNTAAERIRKEFGVTVHTLAADITLAATRRSLLEMCPEPDILITNAGGPPPGDFRDWQRDDWVAALDANMLTPIELIKATLDGMIERCCGRIVNITSSAVKAPIETLGLSNGARAGLTGFVAGLARQTVRHNVTINNLLPGPFDTDRLRQNYQYQADQQGRDFDSQWQLGLGAHPAGRFGDPAEFGAACAFLCSARAGYISGQNWLLDGGAYPGTF